MTAVRLQVLHTCLFVAGSVDLLRYFKVVFSLHTYSCLSWITPGFRLPGCDKLILGSHSYLKIPCCSLYVLIIFLRTSAFIIGKIEIIVDDFFKYFSSSGSNFGTPGLAKLSVADFLVSRVRLESNEGNACYSILMSTFY